MIDASSTVREWHRWRYIQDVMQDPDLDWAVDVSLSGTESRVIHRVGPFRLYIQGVHVQDFEYDRPVHSVFLHIWLWAQLFGEHTLSGSGASTSHSLHTRYWRNIRCWGLRIPLWPCDGMT